MPLPCRVTPVYDQNSLPDALREAHDMKSGLWGVIRVFEGLLRYVIAEPMSEQILMAGRPGLVRPGQLHFVEPIGAVRMQVEYYDSPPAL